MIMAVSREMWVEDWLGKDNKLGCDIWRKKYQHEGETFLEWLDRVSNGNEELKKDILDKKFLFGGRILSNRGLQKQGRKVTYSNCYVIEPPKDNLESIFDAAKKLARTFSYGGGCGIDISQLAPRGAVINNAAKETTGAVSFMDLYNLTTSLIGQNGRRGALMISLGCNHPDLEEFIDIKTDLNKITKANISIRVTDEFMRAVVLGEYYDLTFVREETGEEIVKTVFAPTIFKKLCANNWNYGEPGMLYWDNIEKWNLLADDSEFKFAGVNPCAEEPLPAGGSCLLGAINLSAFVKNGKFDSDDFAETVARAVKALNEVLDEGLELHPLFEQRESVADWRQIGLGIFGLADMLIKMGMEYGSADSIVLCDRIGFVMADTAIGASAYLARDKKPYNKFKPEALDKNLYFIENTREETKRAVKRFGLRNSQLLTIAPTGSISTMLGVSGGIEPIFDISYTRKTESLHGKDQYYEVYTPIVKAYLDNNEVIHNLDTGKPVLPSYFVTAKTIDPMKRVKMQSIWQKHIDASISSTVNLPESATVEDVRKLYIYAWINKLKGLTIFRENCARVGVLTSEKKEEPEVKIEEKDILPEKKVFDKIKPMTRAELGGRLNGGTYVKKTACGKLYITINRDDNDNLVEVFIDPGKSGGCVANAESLGRMASTMLRGGMAIESIVDSVKGVKCSACTQAKGSKKVIDGLSCGDILARTIQEEYDRFNKCENKCKHETEEVKEPSRLENIAMMLNPENWIVPNNTCPECGMEMTNEGGCVTCKNCGYSKCD
jgi:ribonucleoside-diphosphate reductase alpha chain